MKSVKILTLLPILFLIDIISKYIIINKLATGRVYLFNTIGLEFYKNYGIAFGIIIFKYLIISLSILAIIILITLIQKYIHLKNYSLSFFIGLIIIGAISNLTDRIINGYVIDFISIWILPVFNLSDLYITIGVICLILFYKKIPRQQDEG